MNNDHDTSGLFLDRYGQRRLTEALVTIEAHLEDLADTLTRRAVIGRRDLASFRRPKKLRAKAPAHEGAQEFAAKLENTLTTAVRHTCETRGMDYMPVGYTHRPAFVGPLQADEKRIPVGYDDRALSVLTRWLRVHVITFAMTEGCVEWADEIEGFAHDITAMVDLPPDDTINVDDVKVAAAYKQVVTLSTIDTVAHKLGEMGEGLNARRMRTLINQGKLKADSVDHASGTKFYLLGDVLTAHGKHQRRQRAS
ncbi:hypothetical protein [Gordonia westfalica]|uniref:Uncharacterized protein n=3 Tax=Gordonia westfalica TaxID=158898 RepID=A0A1H2E3B1_9ACTN|nr:hypothetical protein [Gordonia westfalica]SDT89525.1 hypothetical protein SAMN04488548_12744 [Gordonia westfalica]